MTDVRPQGFTIHGFLHADDMDIRQAALRVVAERLPAGLADAHPEVVLDSVEGGSALFDLVHAALERGLRELIPSARLQITMMEPNPNPAREA
jgi:hypothetical protein